MPDWKQSILGRTGRPVGRLGLAAGYGADARSVEMAFERGVKYFYWGSIRRASFAEGLRNLAPGRERFMLVMQSYSRLARMVTPWVERGLRKAGMDYADVLLLGMWNKPVAPAILESGRRLRERGLVRHLAVSTHNRVAGAAFAAGADFDIVHMRYNAVHTGGERDFFPALPPPEQRAGVVVFTATSWRQLLGGSKLPAGERVPTAADCYRFVLGRPEVDVCMTGPANYGQLKDALDGWERGPLDADEMAWMRRVGQFRYLKRGLFGLR
jgi:aryl-alcohol dehydrogenase-like predicted oxidoreductase